MLIIFNKITIYYLEIYNTLYRGNITSLYLLKKGFKVITSF